jgi:hypothetical protein
MKSSTRDDAVIQYQYLSRLIFFFFIRIEKNVPIRIRKTGNPLKKALHWQDTALHEINKTFNAVTKSNTGTISLSARAYSEVHRLWRYGTDTGALMPVLHFQVAKLTGHSYRVLYLAMSPDGNFYFSFFMMSFKFSVSPMA